MTSRVASKKENGIPVEGHDKIMKHAFEINVFILFLLILSVYSTAGAFAGGILLIIYLSVNVFTGSNKIFFVIFGTKLMFDVLWVVRVDYSLNLLQLFMIPVIAIIVIGKKIINRRAQRIIWYALIYLLWIMLTMVLNGQDIDYELLLRQSGILFGLLIGLKYIRDLEDFNLLIYMLFISTIIPVLASVVQIIVGQADIPIFHYKFETIREYRYSGLYYDAATAGMVNIVSLFSNAYLINSRIIRKYRILHAIFLPLNILVILTGGTRSIIGVAFLILIISLTGNLKRSLKLMPLVLITIFLSMPHIDKVMLRSASDVKRNIEIKAILTETDYGTMFTGRVSIWQDIWDKFNSGTFLQALFGSGLSSNAHSSYFFLLLQIGWLGLAFYLVFQAVLIGNLLRLKVSGKLKVVALLAVTSLLLIGTSATTVMYTSFQWIIYMIVGGVINMGLSLKNPEAKTRGYPLVYRKLYS